MNSAEQLSKPLRVRGKLTSGTIVGNRIIVREGRWLRIGEVHDEVWIDGPTFTDPASALNSIKSACPDLDVFIFSQRLPETEPRYSFHWEWDNFATIPLGNYNDWWEGRLPQEARKNVRRSVKRGVVVKEAVPDDLFVKGVMEIYNETPIRQGKRFARFGEDFDVVKARILEIAERSTFLGAYFGNELIGFIKLVRVGNCASILGINSKIAHYDKRPTNALLAKSVEFACNSKHSHLIYGRYTYGNKFDELTEFKRRNGFEKTLLPRYVIPLSPKGRLACGLGLHRRWIDILPSTLISKSIAVRESFVRHIRLPMYTRFRSIFAPHLQKEIATGKQKEVGPKSITRSQ